MDDDVKLSMEQAHERWMTKFIATICLIAFSIGGATCAVNERAQQNSWVQREAISHGCKSP